MPALLKVAMVISHVELQAEETSLCDQQLEKPLWQETLLWLEMCLWLEKLLWWVAPGEAQRPPPATKEQALRETCWGPLQLVLHHGLPAGASGQRCH